MSDFGPCILVAESYVFVKPQVRSMLAEQSPGFDASNRSYPYSQTEKSFIPVMFPREIAHIRRF